MACAWLQLPWLPEDLAVPFFASEQVHSTLQASESQSSHISALQWLGPPHRQEVASLNLGVVDMVCMAVACSPWRAEAGQTVKLPRPFPDPAAVPWSRVGPDDSVYWFVRTPTYGTMWVFRGLSEFAERSSAANHRLIWARRASSAFRSTSMQRKRVCCTYKRFKIYVFSSIMQESTIE